MTLCALENLDAKKLLGRGEDYAAHIKGDAGLMAQLDEKGILDLYIKTGENTPRGGAMFAEAMKAFGPLREELSW